jgi:hypothetical protein
MSPRCLYRARWSGKNDTLGNGCVFRMSHRCLGHLSCGNLERKRVIGTGQWSHKRSGVDPRSVLNRVHRMGYSLCRCPWLLSLNKARLFGIDRLRFSSSFGYIYKGSQ